MTPKGGESTKEKVESIQNIARLGLSNLNYATNANAGDFALLLDLAALNFDDAARRVRNLKQKILKNKQIRAKIVK